MNKEIVWNIVNSLLAGALVFLGAFSDGNITGKGLCIAAFAALSVALLQFKDYWQKEKSEYKSKKKKTKKKIGAFIP